MPGAMLALDMGTGKSRCAIDLIVNHRFKHTLIIAPLSVVDGVWANQFRQHCAVEMEICVLGSRSGLVANKLRLAKDARRRAEARKVPCVIVVNYESCWPDPFGAWALSVEWDGLVLDECHKIKSPSGKASLYAARLGRHIPYRLGLTGTPLPHSPLDIFAQYRALEPAIFGASITAFKSKYAILGNAFSPWAINGWKNTDELNEKIYSIAYRVEKHEVLDLPDVQDITRTCRLGPLAREAYDELENEFYAEVAGGVVTASNALVKLLRLQQITSGYVRTEAGYDSQVDTAKQDLLDDIFDEIETGYDAETNTHRPDEPLVVFCRFRHDLDVVRALCVKYKRAYAEISGRHEKGVMGLVDWQEDRASVVAVQIQAGGVGVDLSRARYCVYFSLGFSLGDYEQSRARVHRPGQTRNVIYYHLLAENTVDEKVYRALADKQNVIDAVLNREEGEEVEEQSPKGWQRLD